MTAPGWLYAEGDPPGTQRYWDGEKWIGDPVAVAPSAPGVPHTPGGQQVFFGKRLASPGNRILARIIDVLIAFAIAFLVIMWDLGGTPFESETGGFTLEINSRSLDTRIEAFLFALASFVWAFGWLHLRGGTPGKLLLGLRVMNAENGDIPPDLKTSALRTANYALTVVAAVGTALGGVINLVTFIVGLVSLVMLFTDGHHRTVMDRVAKTLVVSNR